MNTASFHYEVKPKTDRNYIGKVATNHPKAYVTMQSANCNSHPVLLNENSLHLMKGQQAKLKWLNQYHSLLIFMLISHKWLKETQNTKFMPERFLNALL